MCPPEALSDLSTSELRQHLAATLPDYMLPSHFVRVEQLPLTPNGKVDRKVLPDPEPATSATSAHFEPPKLQLKRSSQPSGAMFWLTQVGRNDNFFEVGSNSLLAMQVISRMRSTFGVEIKVRTLF